MTKCKHKGECICGKHLKEGEKIVTLNGVQYFERIITDKTVGDLHFLSLVEYESEIHPGPGLVEFIGFSDVEDFAEAYRESNKSIQKPNQVHVNSTKKIKS